MAGLGVSARYVGYGVGRTAGMMGRAAESGYTRVRGREAYLERQIQALRDQISRLEERVPEPEDYPEREGWG